MEQMIVYYLRKLELEQNIRILYASDVGSRAYGTETDDSDYDVRFIFLRPLRHYVTVTQAEQTISIEHCATNVGFHGWDVIKALQLCIKSNPSLYEWIMSPCVYIKDEMFYQEMKYMIYTHYSLKTLFLHYRSLASKNLERLKRATKESKTYVKTYLQALRGLLMMRWISSHNSFPPLELSKLTNGNTELDKLRCKLIMRKSGLSKVALDFDETLLYELLDLGIEPNLDCDFDIKAKTVDANQLNEFLWKLLEI